MKKRLIVLVLAILALLMIVPLLDSAVDSVRDTASQAQPDPTPAPSPSPTPEPTPRRRAKRATIFPSATTRCGISTPGLT